MTVDHLLNRDSVRICRRTPDDIRVILDHINRQSQRRAYHECLRAWNEDRLS